MKAANLREQTEDELIQICDETIKSLSDIRVKSIIGEALEQPLKIRHYRRDIARIKTVMNEKRSGQNKGSN